MPTLSAGFTSGVSRFEHPLLLPGMPSAVARLSGVGCPQDYGGVGVTSVALLLQVRALGTTVTLVYQPVQGGYGSFQRCWRVVVSWGVHRGDGGYGHYRYTCALAYNHNDHHEPGWRVAGGCHC